LRANAIEKIRKLAKMTFFNAHIITRHTTSTVQTTAAAATFISHIHRCTFLLQVYTGRSSRVSTGSLMKAGKKYA